MMICRVLAAALLAGSGAAQLVVETTRGNFIRDSLYAVNNGYNNQLQAPLGMPSANSASAPFKAGEYTLTQQDNTTCATYGESQWTGTVDVTDGRRLFFWYFESRNDPENDPVVLWLNGGPGASSMMGLFNEMGPCLFEAGASETTPNPWGWNNNASLIVLDQPAGVGLSSLAEGEAPPAADIDGAEDFQTLLNIFFGKIFPEKAHLPIHFAAESYGGHYAPVYIKHIMTSRKYNSPSAFRGNITSIILVDALLDFTAPAVGTYELLCSGKRNRGIINSTACAEMKRHIPEVQRLGQMCDLSYDGFECLAMMTYFLNNINIYYNELIEAGERNPYNIHVGCPKPPLCDDPRAGNFSWYLNQEHVKSALGLPPSFVYESFKWRVNMAYDGSGAMYKPTTREVVEILETGVDDQSSRIRLLVLNGNDDYVINTPGQVWLYDNLRWTGQTEFRTAQWKDLPDDIAATGYWKGTEDGLLVFVAVDGAGHMVPMDAKEGSSQILKRWIGGQW